MYIKYICCEVPNELKVQFSNSQEKWSITKYSSGFLGQIGGWDLSNKNIAVIISFWKDVESLRNFMKEVHDKVTADNEQEKYYSKIKVEYYNSILDMSGNRLIFFKSIIKKSKLIRIADCKVNAEKVDHFEKVQKEIWTSEMKKSKGMLGGKFSKNEQDNLKYLVSTFWSSIAEHQNYVENVLPALRKLAKVSEDLLSITGRKVSVVDSWKIIS